MAKLLTRKKYVYQAILYVTLLALMALSWYFSSLSGSQSNVYSLKLANGLVSNFNTAPVHIKSVDAVNWGIRKLCHLIEYGLMGLVLCAMLNGIWKKAGRSALAALAVMAIWAMLDELHQSLIADRYSRWLDVGIDLTGALIAIFLVSVFVYIRRLRMQNLALLKEIHILTINQGIWDKLGARFAGNMEDSMEKRINEPVLVPIEAIKGGC